MSLAAMRFKDYIWPHNPRVYSIDYRRKLAAHKIPFGHYHLQDLGLAQRVMCGEGEFTGPDAYAQFRALASVFYSEGPGPLIHPIWQSTNAYFALLRLTQQPRADYVKYSFEFWEDYAGYDTVPKELPAAHTAETADTAGAGGTEPVYYTVAAGDTLYAIAQRFGITLDALLSYNPQIKNPNLIYVGQVVRVG